MNSMKDFLTGIDGTDFVYLSRDKNMVRCVEKWGTILIEREIAALPEVKSLGRTDIVLDVGAFIGETALVFGAHGAGVVAFEPQPDAFAAALINTRNYPNICVLNYAIGNGGYIALNQDEMAGNLGTRTVSHSHDGMPVRKLDDLARGLTVTFIKIDVEGFEPEVIHGAMELLRRCKPMLLIEIYPLLLGKQGYDAEAVIKPLRELGYTITEAIGNSTEPRWDILCKA